MEWLKKLRLGLTGLIIILLALAILTLYLIYYFVTTNPADINITGEIRIEIVKILLELLLVVLIGSTVAALFKAYERNQEDQKMRTQIKLDFIKRLGRQYRAVKKVRRTLRWEGIKLIKEDGSLILDGKLVDVYKEQIEKLNDIQLSVEGLKISAKQASIFGKNEILNEHLWRMDNYLNQIVGEYEKVFSEYPKDKKGDLAKLQYLREFTSSAKLISNIKSANYDPDNPDEDATAYGFKKELSLSYGKILKELGK